LNSTCTVSLLALPFPSCFAFPSPLCFSAATTSC
jgi:hypothetical protein